MRKIKVMTFNMRTQTEVDGVNQFRQRKDRILAMLNEQDPDLVGFQEVTDEMRAWLRSSLGAKYTFIGSGRMVDYTGEAVAIALRNDRFELISLESFWLSDTPDIPGSCYANAAQSRWPRMTLSALVKCVDIEKPFYVINTHLDHLGKRARHLGMEQNAKYISALDGHYVYTGDMNAEPNAGEIKVFDQILGNQNGRDVTSALGGTFHNFGRQEVKPKIDYIFTDVACSDTYIVNDEGVDGLYYSDHHAVCAELEF